MQDKIRYFENAGSCYTTPYADGSVRVHGYTTPQELVHYRPNKKHKSKDDPYNTIYGAALQLFPPYLKIPTSNISYEATIYIECNNQSTQTLPPTYGMHDIAIPSSTIVHTNRCGCLFARSATFTVNLYI
jgi:hypothetical protein